MALTTFGPKEYQGPMWGYNKRVTGKRHRQRFLDEVQNTAPCSFEKMPLALSPGRRITERPARSTTGSATTF